MSVFNNNSGYTPTSTYGDYNTDVFDPATYSSGTTDGLFDIKKKEKEQIVAAKKAQLGRKDNADLDPTSYTLMPNGSMEPNKNKIHNDLSRTDLQSVTGKLIADYGIEEDTQGNTFITDQEGNVTPYAGETRRLYMGKGKGGEDIIKVGLSIEGKDLEGTKWEGMDPSVVRYLPEAAKAIGLKKYGWESGPEGIDPSTMQSVLLPWSVATALEATIHGNRGAMENRAAPIYGEGTARFGSGQSEYYKDGVQGIFGDVNQNLSKEEYEDLTKWFDFDRGYTFKLNDYTLNYTFNLMIDNAKKLGANDPSKLNLKKVYSLDIDNLVIEKIYR
jgi:hypothetical protein